MSRGMAAATADGWNPACLPSQNGKNIIITGGTSGIGYEAVLALCGLGADVTIASRNPAKGKTVIERVRAIHPDCTVSFEALDTASMDSVREFADCWNKEEKRLDTLILNAGISNVPKREVTADGFERQLATNYLGHFALTGLLLPSMTDSDDGRIIATSSLAHKRTTLHLDDLQLTKHYSPMIGYAQSKLAVLTFMLELAKRLKESGSDIKAIPIHPGVASTDITRGGDKASPILHHFAKFVFGAMGQSAEQGSWPILYAATSDHVKSGTFYGPSGTGERKGIPGIAKIASHALDEDVASELWEESEGLTNIAIKI